MPVHLLCPQSGPLLAGFSGSRNPTVTSLEKPFTLLSSPPFSSGPSGRPASIASGFLLGCLPIVTYYVERGHEDADSPVQFTAFCRRREGPWSSGRSRSEAAGVRAAMLTGSDSCFTSIPNKLWLIKDLHFENQIYVRIRSKSWSLPFPLE